ncbi:hypothetical protein GCM10008023_32340 [Sphingomonas glacialis]|uniref:Uncharacterized protein n=1 Tax=Sphingomonas glacialis TaxID=658225 RepID=A0ABQ3LPN6_9SPHN|nr:hypothetical protein [Sphingomonas glacialis]GHH22377.1 hypothetical protein GCM10008023_32340 [Sphingomonas glacialis]
MEIIFEILFQFLGEFVLQILFEALSELGFHSLADTFEKPRNPILSTIGFAMWGALAGGISLLIMPRSFISNLGLREANVLITPIAVGAAMTLIGRWRASKGQTRIGIDRFGYAFIFAFLMAIVRFNWAH